MMKKLLTAALLTWMFPAISYAAAPPAVTVDEFIRMASSKTGWTEPELRSVIGQAKMQPRIIELMDKPGEAMLWPVYRERLVTSERVAQGRMFMATYADALKRAEREYGVPPEVIAAIIGVETKYGTIRGSYRVLDALVTLGFSYPRRAAFFQNELLAFLSLSKKNNLDPLTTTGSYAGAMGWPQFMPSSALKIAVDFDGDGVADLNNPVDAIGSIAHYFQVNGWKSGDIVYALPGRIGGNLEMPGVAGAVEYYHILENFKVIKRYNNSNLYALAVTLISVNLRGGETRKP